MFDYSPEYLRNEKEVESKLIVQYLLPSLGYSQNDWHQEVALGSIRLAFYGADKAKAKAIVDARNRKENGKFTDYEDLLNSTKGLAAKGLLSMFDRFRIHNQ